MPVSCSSVGDIIALVQLGIKIVDVLNESRKAPADCRALCNDLRSLERLIALSQPAIDGLQDHTLRELVNEHLESVSRHILDGLRLVCNFDTAFDTSTDHARRHLRQSLRHWATKSKQSIIWALRHNPSARDARATIAQGFTSLIFALLVAFQADQRALAQTLHDAYVNSTTHLAQLAQNLGRSQDSVLADISDVNFFFDKLLVTLGAVREEVAALGERLELGLMKTHLDIAAIRQQLREFQTVAATTTTVERTAEFTQATVERVGISTQQTVESIGMSTLESIKGLEVEVQQGFATISAHCSAVSRHQRDQKQVAARLMANPLISEFARLLHSRDRRQIYGATARQSDLMGQPVMSSILRLPREAISPPVIVCTFLLALRANTASERATYAIFSFLLFVTRNMLRLYKFPAVSRCVIIVDIFYWAKATVSDVKSSTSLQRMVAGNLSDMGRVLLRECNLTSALHFGEHCSASRSPQELPAERQALKNREHILMTVLIGESREDKDALDLMAFVTGYVYGKLYLSCDPKFLWLEIRHCS